MTMSTSAGWLVLLIPCVPLIIASGLMLWPRKPLWSTLAPWAALPALLCSLGLAPPLAIDLPWLLLGTQLGLDQAARIFLFFTASLWLAAGIFAAGYLHEDAHKTRFFVFFLFAMAGNLGLIIARDMLSFYASFAMMSFASYGLIVHNKNAEADRAGRIYIIMVVLGEVLLFAAMVMAAALAGSTLFSDVRTALAGAPTRDLVLALALAGFGIKLGVVGLHVWLPLAHPVAPTPASAVLSGAMIKAGLLGWMQMSPLGEGIALVEWARVLMAVGTFATFYAALIGATQQNPKTVLAYSSVSQMGLVTIAVGLAMALPSRWPEISAALLFLALHHALAKGALFLGVGVAASRITTGWHRWLVAVGLVLPALALAGAPFTSGGLIKKVLQTEATGLTAPWDSLLPAALSWTMVATVLLMARFLYLAWPRISVTGPSAQSNMLAPWAALIAILILSAFNSGLDDGAETVWILSATLSGFGTLALAASSMALGGWILSRTDWRRMPVPAAGDLVVPVEIIAAYAFRTTRRFAKSLSHGLSGAATALKPPTTTLDRPLVPDTITRNAWTLACAMFLALLLLFAMALTI